MDNPLPPEEQPLPEKRGRILIIAGAVLGIMVVAALGVYAWYAVYGPCTRGTVNTTSTALFEQVAAFEAAYQAAASATPIGLMGPVTSMQQILWDTRELTVPACMQFARNELIISMESAIRAFLAVMNGESRETVEGLLQDSQTLPWYLCDRAGVCQQVRAVLPVKHSRQISAGGIVRSKDSGVTLEGEVILIDDLTGFWKSSGLPVD